MEKFTKEDYIKELNAFTEQLNAKAKKHGIFKSKAEEEQEKKEKADRLEKTTETYITYISRYDKAREMIEQLKANGYDLKFSTEMESKYTDDECNCFLIGWKEIPNKDVVYELYKDCLTYNESNELYDKLMQQDLIEEVKMNNQQDTTNNAELIELLDAEGYLTIYHGHVTEDLTNHSAKPVTIEFLRTQNRTHYVNFPC